MTAADARGLDPEALCRICHETRAESGEALISPCACQGSLRHVHASCLDHWRLLNADNRNGSRCQLCRADFRLAGGPLGGLLRAMGGRFHLYAALVRTLSVAALVPLSFGAIKVSNALQRDEVFVSGPADARASPWRQDTFGLVLSRRTLEQINAFIAGRPPRGVSRRALFVYGLSKLGSYGCTVWLFTDGMGDVFPTHTRDAHGHLRPSSQLAVLRAILEFYVIPFCLRTPTSRARLPFFLATTLVGLWFCVLQVERRLRRLLRSLLPFCKRLELGTLASH